MLKYLIIAFLIAQTPIDLQESAGALMIAEPKSTSAIDAPIFIQIQRELERNKQLTKELKERMEEYDLLNTQLAVSTKRMVGNMGERLEGKQRGTTLGDMGFTNGRFTQSGEIKYFNSTYLYTQQVFEDSL